MQIIPYLNFGGQCEEAFHFYAKCLGGQIEAIMRFGDSPMASQVPPDWGSKVIHARLNVSGAILLGSDAPPPRYQPPQGMSVSISIKDLAQSEKAFEGLAEGGSVQMPFQKTFWSAGFGMLVDRFGIPWMVNCEQAAEAAAG